MPRRLRHEFPMRGRREGSLSPTRMASYRQRIPSQQLVPPRPRRIYDSDRSKSRPSLQSFNYPERNLVPVDSRMRERGRSPSPRPTGSYVRLEPLRLCDSERSTYDSDRSSSAGNRSRSRGSPQPFSYQQRNSAPVDSGMHERGRSPSPQRTASYRRDTSLPPSATTYASEQQQQPVSRDQAIRVLYEYNIVQARDHMRHETGRYFTKVREHIQPFLLDKLVMELAAETFYQFEDPNFMATVIGGFLQDLRAAPEEPDDEIGPEEDAGDGEEAKNDQDPEDGGSRPREEEPSGSGGSTSTGFMQWSSFEPHPLSRNADIVDNRRKSLVALANGAKVGAPTPIGPATFKGFLGLLIKVLKPQDWRAYFRASGARNIFLPMPIHEKPNATQLEMFEDNLFGSTQFTGRSSMMTCLSCSKYVYGTLTQFKVEKSDNYEGGKWPMAIRPVAAMTYVPRKLLKKVAKDVHKSNKTTLQMEAKATMQKDRFRWKTPMSDGGPFLAHSRKIKRSKLPDNIQEALAIEPSWLQLEGGKTANLVCTTVPEMVAWLHVKASLLTDVDIETTEIRRSGGTNDVKGIARWKTGPTQRDHRGKDPLDCCIAS